MTQMDLFQYRIKELENAIRAHKKVTEDYLNDWQPDLDLWALLKDEKSGTS
ncbi:hypothetical protein UFOVP1279_57 [uncultured Caudovirales phage]|uniref:Uncharacterized protein n=1 Tax=uncultured Caudovirales phage TaxID=2100421 RepID=A0A6J5RTB3_9CAUD|nr:hypothetical protein UFOVP1279_57 [uncultured Caudovirales phage]